MGEHATEHRHRAAEPHRVPARITGFVGTVASSAANRPPGRSTRAHSANTASRSTKLRSANPHVMPSSAPSGKGSTRRRPARAARRCARPSIPAEKSRPIGVQPAPARSRQRSPVPHARSRTRDPGRDAELVDGAAAPPAVEAERDDAVHAVVRGASRSNMPSTAPAWCRPGAARRRRPSTGAHTRSQPGSLRGGELARVADGLEVLLRDLEQHAAEVVRDERGDGREQRAERVDEPLGLLVVGEVRVLERSAHVLVEHLDRVGGDRASRRGDGARARAAPGAGSRLRAGAGPAQHVGVGLGVAGPPVALLRDDQPFAGDRLEQGRGHADPRRQVVEGQQLGVARLRAGDRGRERRVGRRRAHRRASRRITASEKPWRWSSLMRPRRSTWSAPYQAIRPSRRGGGSSWRFW